MTKLKKKKKRKSKAECHSADRHWTKIKKKHEKVREQVKNNKFERKKFNPHSWNTLTNNRIEFE